MAWSSDPVEPEHHSGRSWWSTPPDLNPPSVQGWFNFSPELAAHTGGAGTLTAVVEQIQKFIHPQFSGGGEIVTALSEIQTVAAQFSNRDTSEYGTLYSGFSAWLYSLDTKLVYFGGDGQFVGDLPDLDGLTAWVVEQYDGLDNASSIGTLVAAVYELYTRDASFASVGELWPQITGGNRDGLDATWLLGAEAQESSVGTLEAAIYQKYLIATDFASAGSLTASAAPLAEERSAALSGAGVLAATATEVFDRSVTLTGAGTLTAGAAVKIEPGVKTFSDDFERTGPAIGGDWIEIVNGSFYLISGYGQVGTLDLFAVAHLDETFGSVNHSVTYTIGSTTETAAVDFIYLMVRADAGFSTGVYAVIEYGNYPVMSDLTEVGGGDTGPDIVQWVEGDVFTFTANESTYTVTQNDVEILSWEDTEQIVPYSSECYPYLVAAGNLGEPGNSTWIDDFSATDLSPGESFFTSRGSLSATVMVPVVAEPATPATLYQDNFDRANNSSLGAGWTNRILTMGISSNAAKSNTTGSAGATFDTAMPTDDMEVYGTLQWDSATVNFQGFWLGSNTSGERIQVWTYPAIGVVALSTFTSWADSGTTATSGAAAIGDAEWKLKRVGNIYTVYRNGASQLSWTDSSNVLTRDSSHRLTGVASYPASGGGSVYDFNAKGVEVPTGGPFFPSTGTLSATASKVFNASRMTKSGTQTWATSSTWVDITSWTAVNDGTYKSTLSAPGLKVWGSGTSKTIAASVPFSGGSSSRTHKVRIVRVSDSAVVVTGAGVAANSGTCTASVVMNVVNDEVYKIQMNSTGSSSGTVTATTSTLTIS